MNIRPQGLEWLRRRARLTGERIVVSKYYVADESWPRKPVWWFEFPADATTNDSAAFLNLLCQVAPDSQEFHHLRIPLRLLRERRSQLGFRHPENRYSLYLSAEEGSLFTEIRGHGKVEFGMFKVDQPTVSQEPGARKA